MRNIWVRIGLTAGAIFGVGMLIIYGIRVGKDQFHRLVDSSDDIRIPLMGIVPFQLGNDRMGDIRRLTLMRDAPQHLTGVRVEARLGDSVKTDIIKDCAFLTVNDPEHLDNRTRFTCVSDTAGLGSFGTVEITHRQGGEPTVFVRTLVLPAVEIQQLQQAMGPRISPDSAKMAELQRMGDSLQAMGDSISGATRVQVEIARQRARGAGRGAGRFRIETRAVPPPTPPAAPAPKP